MTIMRIWHGWTAPQNADAYEQLLKSEILPGIHRIDGYGGAFLQREPDAGGQCFWTNDACAVGRKHPIRAFEVSIEFGNLVSGLYDDGPAPTCHPGE